MILPHAFNAHVQPPVWDWISLYQEHSPADAREWDFVMGIQSSFTVDFLQQVIAAKLRFYGIKSPHVHAGGFNQFRQDLMRPESDYYRMKPRATALILDPINVSRSLETGDLNKIVETHVAVLPESMLVISNAFLSSEYPVHVHELNGKIHALARECPQVRILDMESWVARW